ncbi:MAG: UDP-3-O-(3-hydroxymyristoyl)glucosamine N-acyltransferase, partial [Candidatus Kapaibacteriota bacterium]
GSDVFIGKNTIIYPNVTIMNGTIIGDNCIIHPGAVIGSDGFGYYEEGGKYIKIPQIGNVVIEDNVEIGANTTIDRSFIGSTIIKCGVKIDNLVQIGHNCVIGENSAMASQVGIAGTVTIGKNVRLGGQVGLAGHLKIADNVTIIAQSGVSKTILESGTYFGSPIKEATKAFKIEATLRNLPDLAKEVSNLKKEVANLNKLVEKC